MGQGCSAGQGSKRVLGSVFWQPLVIPASEMSVQNEV